jgi:hypothetical protein
MRPKKFFFVMIGVLFLAAGISAAGFWWADKQLKAQSLQTSTLLAERDALNKKVDDLNQVKSSTLNLDEVSLLIEEVLPSEKQQDNLIASIINTATREAGIAPTNIVSISFSTSGQPNNLSGATQSKEVPGVYYYPFTLSLRNISYGTLLNLLGEFEKNKRIIQTDQVQISPNKAIAGQLSSVTLTLRTYIKP